MHDRINAQDTENYDQQEPVQHVLQDILHVFRRLPISHHHGYATEFIFRMRDVLLKPHPEDRLNLENHFQKQEQPSTFEAEYNNVRRSSWVLKRCRRITEKPTVLASQLKDLFDEFGGKLDHTTRKPLFDHKAWAKAKAIIEDARLGFLSDPPDVQLYVLEGRDINGLPLYRCMRGTNLTESIHQKLVDLFSGTNCGPEITAARLLEFCYRYNVRQASRVFSDFKDLGHYDLYLLDYIHLATTEIYGEPIDDWWKCSTDYAVTEEHFIIAPVQTDFHKPEDCSEIV